VISTLATAQSTAPYHSGKLLQMESVQCVAQSPDSTGGSSKACEEYVLKGDGVLFHLHPKKGGEPALLPVGKILQYRLVEGRFYLKFGARDHEFTVVAMEPLESREQPVHSAQTINHLQ
jgi:hypothetical protein